MTGLSRRGFLGASPVLITGCTRTSTEYFGNTDPPSRQCLLFENMSEPDTLDPHKSQSASEERILPSLFEGLTTPHPATLEPLAGMATHYEVASDFTRFRFFLRGHRNPRGVRLPDGSAMMAGGYPADWVQARWSDNAPVTAHDFVYSWRRALAPETASGYGISYYECIENAASIMSGKAAPERLGVVAPDDFTLEVRMAKPAPHFLSVLWVFGSVQSPRALSRTLRGPAQRIVGRWRIA